MPSVLNTFYMGTRSLSIPDVKFFPTTKNDVHFELAVYIDHLPIAFPMYVILKSITARHTHNDIILIFDCRLVILHASELATELFDELQSPICMFTMSISRPQSLPNVVASRACYYATKQNGV